MNNLTLTLGQSKWDAWAAAVAQTDLTFWQTTKVFCHNQSFYKAQRLIVRPQKSWNIPETLPDPDRANVASLA